MSERTVTKNVETRVLFTNSEVIEILQRALGAPEDIKGYLRIDDDSFYGDLEIVWMEKIEETFGEDLVGTS